jgi:hypothetical protein
VERRLEYMALRGLIPNPRNAKTHDVAGVRASINRFGMVDVIAIDERTGMLVSGHGRVESLRAEQADGRAAPEGVEDRPDDWYVPVVRGWASATDDEADGATVAVNRWTEAGGWDWERLVFQLDQLASVEDGLIGVGYERNDIDDLLARIDEEREAEEAAAVEPDATGRQVRSLMFDFPISDYEWVVKASGRARRAFGVGSNAELFGALLRADV